MNTEAARAAALEALEVIDRRPGFEAGGRDSFDPVVCRAYRKLAAALDAIYGPVEPITTAGTPHRDIVRR